MIGYLCFLSAVLSTWFAVSTAAADPDTYRYTVRTGPDMATAVYSIERSDRIIVRFAREDDRQVSYLDSDRATLRWEWRNEETDTDIVAELDGEAIAVRGKYKGEPVEKRLKIDDQPWYQQLAVSLIPFVKSEESETEFIVLRPFDFKPFVMRARKEQTERIEVSGNEVKALRVKVNLTGLFSRFWSSRYWYRKSDGVYLKYKGANGPPGTPETVMELIETGE